MAQVCLDALEQPEPVVAFWNHQLANTAQQPLAQWLDHPLDQISVGIRGLSQLDSFKPLLCKVLMAGRGEF